MKNLLTTPEAAEILNVTPNTLRKWRCEGRGPRYIRLGGPRSPARYRREDLEAWMEARTYVSTSDESVRAGGE